MENTIAYAYKNTKVYICPTNIIKYENWEKNRTPDDSRVVDMVVWLKRHKLHVLLPGTISAWKRPNSDIFVIYDGIHRLEAAKMYQYNNNDLDIKCIFHATITDNENDIVDNFININKSISVPFIYNPPSYSDVTEIKRIKCKNIISEICSKYPYFLSPSKRPQKPNFNRDMLSDFIYDLDIDFTKDNCERILLQILEKLNLQAKQTVQNNKLFFPQKCEKYNFYLFYLPLEQIKNTIERVIEDF